MESKPVRIYDIRVTTLEPGEGAPKEIGIKEVAVDIRMPGAKKSLDTATFVTNHNITIGSKVVIWYQDRPLFEGIIEHIGIARGKDGIEGLYDITATCTAS